MSFLQLKAMRTFVAFIMMWAILCWACAESENAANKDVAKMDVEDSAKDAKDEGPKDDAKDSAKDGATDTDSNNSSTEDPKPQNTTDDEKPKNETEKEREELFLEPKEAMDFLGIGEMFDDPDHHKFLAQDYFTMEDTDYWQLRCEEIEYKIANNEDAAATLKMPAYCPAPSPDDEALANEAVV